MTLPVGGPRVQSSTLLICGWTTEKSKSRTMLTSKTLIFWLVSCFAIAVDGRDPVKRSVKMHLTAGEDKAHKGAKPDERDHDVFVDEAKLQDKDGLQIHRRVSAQDGLQFHPDIFAEYAHMSEEEFDKMVEEETRPLRHAFYELIDDYDAKMKEAAEKDPMMKIYLDLYGNRYGNSEETDADYLAYKANKTAFAKHSAVVDESENDELPPKAIKNHAQEKVVKKQPHKVPDMLNFDASLAARRQATVDALGNIRAHVRSE